MSVQNRSEQLFRSNEQYKVACNSLLSTVVAQNFLC